MFRVPPAHVMRVEADGAVTQRRYWSPAEIKPVRLGSDQAYAEGLRDCLDRAVRRQMRSAHPVGSLLSGGLDSSSVSVLAARALGEKNERLAAFTGVPRRGFDGAVPAGTTPTKRRTSMRLRARRQYRRHLCRKRRCDDFAELERFFIALEGPVRNPTNLGWVLATAAAGARARPARAARRLYGNCTISWNGWSQAVTISSVGGCSRRSVSGNFSIATRPYSRWVALRKLFVEPLVPERLGNWADRRRPAASRLGRITPRSAPTSPPRWRSIAARGIAATIFTIGCGRRTAGRVGAGRLCR